MFFSIVKAQVFTFINSIVTNSIQAGGYPFTFHGMSPLSPNFQHDSNYVGVGIPDLVWRERMAPNA
jgi:hypothetical protein